MRLSKKISDNLRWLVATFFSILSAVVLLESQLNVPFMKLQLAAINIFGSLFITVVAFLFALKNKWRFEHFLGLSAGDSITLVISAYRDQRQFDPSNTRSNLRYYKMKDGERSELVGAREYLTGLETTIVVAEFLYKLRELADSEIAVMKDNVRITQKGPIICFGSPNSNMTTEQYVPSELCQFIGSDKLLLTKIHEKPYQATEQVDYGILGRFRHHDHDGKEKWAFIFAGIDEEGTVAASFYFLREWMSLQKGKGPFVHLIRCEKATPRDAEKVAGLQLDKDGTWKSD